jgi:zinc transport system ATP-binding protein
MSQKILEVKDLGVSFDDNKILNNIRFSVEKGEVLAVVGPNGSGKSVLLRALLDLIPYQGEVSWKPDIKIGYVPQKVSIEKDLPLSVREFLGFKDDDLENMIKILKSLGFKDEHEIKNHILNKKLGLLSGGQLQRILIAWSLLDHPDVLLYDEPTSGVDVSGEETIYNLLKNLKDQTDMTMIIISHDLNMVYKYANNVVCINKEMICHGIPQEVLDPVALAKLYGGQASFYQHEHK